MTDAKLLRRAQRGDETAFLLLYERHRAVVFRFSYRLLGSVPAAEDVTHDCFLSLLSHPDRFDPTRASLRTYLCASARNLAFNRLRREHRHDAVDAAELESQVTSDDTPLKRLLAEETVTRVRTAVLALSPLQREVIILCEYEEFSLAETAGITGTEIGTVKSRLHRARERLRRALSSELTVLPTTAAKKVRS